MTTMGPLCNIYWNIKSSVNPNLHHAPLSKLCYIPFLGGVTARRGRREWGEMASGNGPSIELYQLNRDSVAGI